MVPGLLMVPGLNAKKLAFKPGTISTFYVLNYNIDARKNCFAIFRIDKSYTLPARP